MKSIPLLIAVTFFAGITVCTIFPDSGFPYIPVGKCPPRDTNVTVYLTDSQNCSVYYVCSNGRPLQLACAGGTVFNPELNVCDNPLDYQCDLPKDMEVLPETVIGTCPPSGEDFPPVLLPDSQNCTIYYFCFNGTAVYNECTDGLEFNPVTMWCEDPETFECNLP